MIPTICRSILDSDAARCILVAKLDVVEITDLVDSSDSSSEAPGSAAWPVIDA